ncbi:hypothetical protein [Paenibacillus chitinolyticus]|uniref:hypothetical protein n=1 Tax=Paenibacillus chitinolyticus TaxID=79263 RepID=UPI0036713FB8
MLYMDKYLKMREDRKRAIILVTNGYAKDNGAYNGCIYKDDQLYKSLGEIKNYFTGGLKLMRFNCAEFLASEGYPEEYQILHYCHVENREEKFNTLELWTIAQLRKNNNR